MARAGVMPNVNDPTWVNLISRFTDRMYQQADQDQKFADRTSDILLGERIRQQDIANEPTRTYERQRAAGQAQLDTQQESVERGLTANPATANRRYRNIPPDIDALIVRKATEAGRPDLIDYMRRNVSVESSGGQRLVNPTSSARGLFQFMQRTGRQYGMMTEADRMDPVKNTQAMIQFTIDNENALRRAGVQVNPQTLYLAHQQGVGGAIALLRNPNARAADVVPSDNVRLNVPRSHMRRWNTMTAGEFASLWMGRFGDVSMNRRDTTANPVRTALTAANPEGQTTPSDGFQTDEQGRRFRVMPMTPRDAEMYQRQFPGRVQVDPNITPTGRLQYRIFDAPIEGAQPIQFGRQQQQPTVQLPPMPATRGVAAQPPAQPNAQPAAPNPQQPRQMNNPNAVIGEEEEDEEEEGEE